MKKFPVLFVTFLLFRCFLLSYGDIVELTDGTILTGKLYYKNGKIRISARPFLLKEIKYIKFTGESKDSHKDASNKSIKKQSPGRPLNADELKLVQISKKFERKFSDYPALVLEDLIDATLRKDGTYLYRYRMVYKILKEGYLYLARRSISFEEGRSKIRVIEAKNISPDNKVYVVKKSDIKISTPSAGMQYFGYIKNLSFTIPKVKPGSIIVIDFEEDNYNPFKKNFFFIRDYFQDHLPVRKVTFKVTLPAEKELFFVTSNLPETFNYPKIVKHGEFKTYVWKRENVPPIIPEPYMPAFSEVAGKVVCSIYKDWKSFLKWRKELAKDRFQVTPQIKKLVEKLTRGAENIEEKIARLYHFVQREIRYVSIKSGISSGYAGHTPQETLKRQFGDCVDKAILLVTLLKAIFVPAYPISIKVNSTGRMETRLPGFDTNHHITKVVLKGRKFFLDATSENYRYPYFRSDDHGVPCQSYMEEKLDFVEVPPPSSNAQIIRNEMTLTKDNVLIIKREKRYTGPSEAHSRAFWKSIKPAERLRVLERSVNSISPGGKVLTFEVVNLNSLAKPFIFRATYKYPDYSTSAANFFIFKLFDSSYSFPEASLKERKYDIVYSTSKLIESVSDITFAQNYKIKYLPSNISLKNKYAEFNVNFEKKSENHLILKIKFVRKKRIIKKEDYQEYRDFLKKVESFKNQRVFLVKKGDEANELH